MENVASTVIQEVFKQCPFFVGSDKSSPNTIAKVESTVCSTANPYLTCFKERSGHR